MYNIEFARNHYNWPFHQLPFLSPHYVSTQGTLRGDKDDLVRMLKYVLEVYKADNRIRLHEDPKLCQHKQLMKRALPDPMLAIDYGRQRIKRPRKYPDTRKRSSKTRDSTTTVSHQLFNGTAVPSPRLLPYSDQNIRASIKQKSCR